MYTELYYFIMFLIKFFKRSVYIEYTCLVHRTYIGYETRHIYSKKEIYGFPVIKKCKHNKTSDMLSVVNQRKMCVAWKSFLYTESSEVVPKQTNDPLVQW